MNDESVLALAREAGIAITWRDYANKPHRVSIETIRRVLAALGLPCDSAEDLSWSRRQLVSPGPPPLIPATAAMPLDLAVNRARLPAFAHVISEDDTELQLPLQPTRKGVQLVAPEPGYYQLEFGEHRTALAVAPQRCFTVADAAPLHTRLWGLAVQTYGLRSPGDLGIGDMAGVVALAGKAAALKADALALSPLHALFAADPKLYSPYAPSSRLFYNPLYADPRSLFGDARVQKAAVAAGVGDANAQTNARRLIDWPTSANSKMALFRCLFEDFAASDLVTNRTVLALDFARYRDAAGSPLRHHAVFEALQAARLAAEPTAWSWRSWQPEWRDPHSDAVEGFALSHQKEIMFHSFLQWIAARSLAAAQQASKQAGMRIGLISDLAVGMSSDGSDAWANQKDLLTGLEVGAPPDLFNEKGQNWGLTTFSPRALSAGGFEPFIAMLRACLRHCGGMRIDHAMGLSRLWVIPRGAASCEGAYLAYPFDDLLRLIALESHRQRGIIIGEDLGTVPAGFRGRLSKAGIYGMRILWFERRRSSFIAPQDWPADAVAMTSTHDLPTVAGWWSGRDIETRRELGLFIGVEQQKEARQNDRQSLWRSFKKAKVADGGIPSTSETARAADAAVKFIARTSSQLALLPLEDALGVEDQPNLPGTIDQHPNWRRYYPAQADQLLTPTEVQQRLAPLARRSNQ
jgi:4-alpha-glucanotransferase